MKCFICYNNISYRMALEIRDETDLIVIRGDRIFKNKKKIY